MRDYEALYEVSDLGQVRSIKRENGVGCRKTGGVLHSYERKRGAGYQCVVLCRYGERRRKLVHRLVLEAFVGPCPGGMQTRHLNGDSGDNRLANLTWGTSKENIEDRRRHGRVSHGEQHGNAKLTANDVSVIRALAKQGCTHQSISGRFGIDRSQVGNIVRGRQWKFFETA